MSAPNGVLAKTDFFSRQESVRILRISTNALRQKLPGGCLRVYISVQQKRPLEVQCLQSSKYSVEGPT